MKRFALLSSSSCPQPKKMESSIDLESSPKASSPISDDSTMSEHSSEKSPLSVNHSSPISIPPPQSPAAAAAASAPIHQVASPSCSISSTSYACLLRVAHDAASPLICEDSGYSPPPSPAPSHIADWLDAFSQFSLPDKHKALDRLLSHCDSDQIRFVYHTIEPQFQFDFTDPRSSHGLPEHVILKIFGFLKPKDLLKCAMVSKRWQQHAEDQLLWRELCEERNIPQPYSMESDSLLWRCPWKASYMADVEIDRNWRSMPLDTKKTMRAHDTRVITCLQYCEDENKVVSGSEDMTLRVWNLEDGSYKSLCGHTGGVWACEVIGQLVVSGSTDRTLKVWSMETGECLHTLEGHTSTVRCIALHDDIAVSGARDASVRLWNIRTGMLLKHLVGHEAAIRCVEFDGKRVVSGAYDCHVKVWDPETGECLFTLEGHSQRVYSLQFDGVHAVSGSLDTSIIVWDVYQGRMKHILRGHRSLTSSMVLKNNILVSGNADTTVRIWNILTGQCLHTLQCGNKHQSAVTGLQFCRDFIVSASDDGSVKLWDLHTGSFIRNLVALSSAGIGGVVWRIQCSDTLLICAVGSRNQTEETQLMVFDFSSKQFALKAQKYPGEDLAFENIASV